MDLDQLEAAGDFAFAVDRGMGRLDQRRFAHTPRAPQKRIVGRQAAGEALGVLDQKVAHAVDPAQERKVDAVDPRDRRQRAAVGAPDEGPGRLEIGLRRGRRRGALKRSAIRRRRSAWLSRGGKGQSSSIEVRAVPQFSRKLQRVESSWRGLEVNHVKWFPNGLRGLRRLKADRCDLTTERRAGRRPPYGSNSRFFAARNCALIAALGSGRVERHKTLLILTHAIRAPLFSTWSLLSQISTH